MHFACKHTASQQQATTAAEEVELTSRTGNGAVANVGTPAVSGVAREEGAVLAQVRGFVYEFQIRQQCCDGCRHTTGQWCGKRGAGSACSGEGDYMVLCVVLRCVGNAAVTDAGSPLSGRGWSCGQRACSGEGLHV